MVSELRSATKSKRLPSVSAVGRLAVLVTDEKCEEVRVPGQA